MNLNKFMLGIGGVMALSLTSCHEDPEYTPAAAEVTPPAYFNLSDDTVVDLEDTSSDFTSIVLMLRVSLPFLFRPPLQPRAVSIPMFSMFPPLSLSLMALRWLISRWASNLTILYL